LAEATATQADLINLDYLKPHLQNVRISTCGVVLWSESPSGKCVSFTLASKKN